MIRRGLTGCIILTLFLLVPSRAAAQDKLRIVTTLPDLAYLADEIGGDLVETFSIATGYQNPHFVDPKPSYILKLTRADMFITVGLDLELGWVPALLNSARNSRIQPGGEGYVDASTDVPLLEVPTRASREEGDIHIFGNPHYWLDPDRVQIVARNITNALNRLSPSNKSQFDENLERFSTRLDSLYVEWKERMEPYRGAHIVAYHNQWPYFEEAFGLDIADFLEPKPGIPPTPSQLALIIRHMQQDNLKVLIIAPYYKQDAANLVVSRVNGVVVPLASSVGAYDGIDTVFDLFDYNVELMVNAFESATE